jgi:hypothetical protein
MPPENPALSSTPDPLQIPLHCISQYFHDFRNPSPRSISDPKLLSAARTPVSNRQAVRPPRACQPRHHGRPDLLHAPARSPPPLSPCSHRTISCSEFTAGQRRSDRHYAPVQDARVHSDCNPGIPVTCSMSSISISSGSH